MQPNDCTVVDRRKCGNSQIGCGCSIRYLNRTLEV